MAHGSVISMALRRFLGSNYDQHDSTRQHQSAQDRRERDGLLGINAGLKWANVYNFLAACVADPLVSKSYDPEKDENDPNKRYRFDTHKTPSYSLNSYQSLRA